jgi:hypothetical protein
VNVFEEILDKKRHRFGGQSREVWRHSGASGTP